MCMARAGCTALILAPSFKSSDYIGMIRTLVPELSRSRPGHLASHKLPTLRYVIRLGPENTPGMLNFDDIPALATTAHDAEVLRLAWIMHRVLENV